MKSFAAEQSYYFEAAPEEVFQSLTEPKMLVKWFLSKAELDQKARQKIESQRRTILEGTPEWDILYRKYYIEEVKKLGI